jgi:DNA-binding MarR family transcriptional regulator
MSELTTNELTVLESLQGATDAVSQRELARRTGFSVGLVNAVLKKLIHTGYVKTSHLNRRSIEYLLTPQGFAQTALRSYRYIVNTMRGYREIQCKLQAILAALQAEGFTDFYLHGEGELAGLVALFFEDAGMGQLKRAMPQKGEAQESRCVVLNTDPVRARKNGWKVVDLIHEFSNSPRQTSEGKKNSVQGCAVPASRDLNEAVEAMKMFYKVQKGVEK